MSCFRFSTAGDKLTSTVLTDDGKLNALQKEVVLKKIREDDKTTIILLS